MFADNLSQCDSSVYPDAGNVNVGFEPHPMKDKQWGKWDSSRNSCNLLGLFWSCAEVEAFGKPFFEGERGVISGRTFFLFFFIKMKDEAPFLFGVNKIIKNVISIPPSGVGIVTPGLSTRHWLSGAWAVLLYSVCFQLWPWQFKSNGRTVRFRFWFRTKLNASLV